MNESRIQVSKTGCISILNSIFPEVEFGHEGSNDVMVHDYVDVFPLEFEVDGIQCFKDVHQLS